MSSPPPQSLICHTYTELVNICSSCHITRRSEPHGSKLWVSLASTPLWAPKNKLMLWLFCSTNICYPSLTNHNIIFDCRLICTPHCSVTVVCCHHNMRSAVSVEPAKQGGQRLDGNTPSSSHSSTVSLATVCLWECVWRRHLVNGFSILY